MANDVSQLDRDALAAYYKHPLIANDSMAVGVLSEKWQDGCSDAELAILETLAAHRIAAEARGMEAAAKIVEKDAEGMSWSESASISGAGFELIKRAAAIRAALTGGQHE
jgi:hypothetical protein